MKIFPVRIIRSLLTISMGGLFIGLYHPHDGMVALVLAIAGAWFYRETYLKNPSQSQAFVLISGMFISGSIGTLVEFWGIHNGYWAYHDLSNGSTFPLWLPIAWALAFLGLYRIESFFVERIRLTSTGSKLALITAFSLLLPTWGEIIAINMGVWSYSWGHQLLGVPLLAILLLTLFHLGVFIVMSLLCTLYQVRDNVLIQFVEEADSIPARKSVEEEI